ncbi:hypothetical protein BJ970_001265 [Saccharopolyspora phatthalungensis]|uniref:Uncharacterized protein n=2 Tax=Saccharopolyspora phatthalungensis TaxID=664693 RepID=A0A840Q2C9_9PSEU|nr:hypothetical protein [Saccharopolyspora phatthalungensis]MBB5153731.1 hypothetical protein [Saccharopolyspora phatthalungensis]
MSWGVHGLTPNATVIEQINAQAFFTYIKNLLATPTAPARKIT